jgi:hypothetical protein
MDAIARFVEASDRRTRLVRRLKDMLDVSVPVPPDSPATPTSALNFAKGFPEPRVDTAYPEVWNALYKELWDPRPEGNSTETNGADVYVDSETETDGIRVLDLWNSALNEARRGAGFDTFVAFAKNHPVRSSQDARPKGHIDVAMAYFNAGACQEAGFDEDERWPLLRFSACARGAEAKFRRALTFLEDSGGGGGGASARYDAARAEVRERVEARIESALAAREEAWRVNSRAARESAETARTLAVADDAERAGRAWKLVKTAWETAISAKNGTVNDATSYEWDFSGPEGKECERGIEEAVANIEAAENARD